MTLTEKYRQIAKDEGSLLDFDASAEYLESVGYDLEDIFTKYEADYAFHTYHIELIGKAGLAGAKAGVELAEFLKNSKISTNYGKPMEQIKRLFRFPRKLKKQIKKKGLWEGLC
jgi:hypothetical protein